MVIGGDSENTSLPPHDVVIVAGVRQLGTTGTMPTDQQTPSGPAHGRSLPLRRGRDRIDREYARPRDRWTSRRSPRRDFRPVTSARFRRAYATAVQLPYGAHRRSMALLRRGDLASRGLFESAARRSAHHVA